MQIFNSTKMDADKASAEERHSLFLKRLEAYSPVKTDSELNELETRRYAISDMICTMGSQIEDLLIENIDKNKVGQLFASTTIIKIDTVDEEDECKYHTHAPNTTI
jgi:hypothetical protein